MEIFYWKDCTVRNCHCWQYLHCDNQGSDKVNDPLSQKRSEAIVKQLVLLGIEPARLTAVGKGSHEPVADNGTEEGRAKNRREEFVKK